VHVKELKSSEKTSQAESTGRTTEGRERGETLGLKRRGRFPSFYKACSRRGLPSLPGRQCNVWGNLERYDHEKRHTTPGHSKGRNPLPRGGEWTYKSLQRRKTAKGSKRIHLNLNKLGTTWLWRNKSPVQAEEKGQTRGIRNWLLRSTQPRKREESDGCLFRLAQR